MGDADAGAPGYTLTATGRCVHRRSYVAALARRHGFIVRTMARRVIRQNSGADVMGDLTVLEFVGPSVTP